MTGTEKIGNGDGTFHVAILNATSYVTNIMLADLNGDGNLDFAGESAAGQGLGVGFGDGNGGFSTPSMFLTRPYFNFTVVAADIDGDGRMDLAAAYYYDNAIGVFLGHGDGTFQGAQLFSVGNLDMGLAAGDFNGNGKIDLVTGNAVPGNVTVLINSTP